MDVLTPSPRRLEAGRGSKMWLVPAAAGVLAFALYGGLLLWRAETLLVPAYDTAFFEQVVWNVGHGRGFQSSFFGADFLGLHFSPLLALPAGLMRLWPDPRLLSLLYAAALGATAPAAYLFLRALLGGRPGAPLAAAALAAPLPLWAELQQAARAGFHPEAFGLPLVLLAGWAGLRGRALPCLALALAALGAREDQAYAVAVIGLLLLRYAHPRWLGAALGVGGLLWGAALELAVMPALRGPVPSQIVPYYHWLPAASPAAVAAALAQPEGWLAFGGLLAGLAFLPLIRPGWLALSLPPLLGDLLSAHFPQPELRLQYGLPLVVPLLVAGGLGARRLLADPLPRAALAGLALPALLVAVAWSPLYGQVPVGVPPALGRLAACTTALPGQAPLAADDDVAVPLAGRPVLRLLDGARPSDYALFDRAGRVPDYWNRGARGAVAAALPGQGRRLLCDDGRFQLWGPVAGAGGAS